MSFLIRVFAWLLRRRYRLQVSGLEAVRAVATPMLILFEHPAQVDSFLQAAVLTQTRSRATGRRLTARYLAARDFAILPIVRELLGDSLLPVPETTPRRRRVLLIELLIQAAVATLKRGENVSLAPVGALLREDGRTTLGGKSGTSQILRQFAPGEVTVVTTRFEGLYGSVTSRALTGEAPDPRRLLIAIRAFAKGFLFFSCRRAVAIQFAVHPDFPVGEAATVPAVNERLEAIFNARRTPVFAPYNRFDRRTLRELPAPAPRRRETSVPDFLFYDESLGAVSRRKFAVLVEEFARQFVAWPEREFGNLLPNQTTAAAAILALRLAGKPLVAFDPEREDPSLAKVLTSERMLDRLAEQRIVLESRERTGGLVDLAALLKVRTLRRFWLGGWADLKTSCLDERARRLLRRWPLEPGDTVALILPLHRRLGQAVLMAALSERGVRIVFPPETFDAQWLRARGVTKLAATRSTLRQAFPDFQTWKPA